MWHNLLLYLIYTVDLLKKYIFEIYCYDEIDKVEIKANVRKKIMTMHGKQECDLVKMDRLICFF